MLTLKGSFLDYLRYSAYSLLAEASKDPGASVTTRQLVMALSDLESGWAPALWSHYIGCEPEVVPT